MCQRKVLEAHRISLVCTDIDEIRLVTGMQVMNNRSFIQMCKFRHIVCFIEFCRIDLVDLVGVHFPWL